MRILLIHQGFPGQFKHLVSFLQERDHELWVISKPRKADGNLNGIHYLSYKLQRCNTEGIHPLCLELESKIIRAEAVANQAFLLRKQGFTPDLILGHPGWGEMLFLKDIWQNVPQLHYVEFFHGVPGTDDDFNGEISRKLEWWDRARARIKNTHHLNSLNTMTCGLSPTKFQHSLLPNWAQERTRIIHDGIDTLWLKPDASAKLQLPSSKDSPNPLTIKAGDPIVTFINRTFEPYRGIHIFMQALIKLQAIHPKAQVLLIGHDTPNVSYGARRTDGIGWLTTLREQHEGQLDWSRIHSLGMVKHQTLRRIYQISAAHVYLSYPFVLSWSMLEAMSCGCLVIGSETPPVQEFIQDGENGLLVPFDSAQELCNSLNKVLTSSSNLQNIRNKARDKILRECDLKNCLLSQSELIESL